MCYKGNPTLNNSVGLKSQFYNTARHAETTAHTRGETSAQRDDSGALAPLLRLNIHLVNAKF